MRVQSAQCEQLSCHGSLVMRGIQQLNGLRAVLQLCPAMKWPRAQKGRAIIQKKGISPTSANRNAQLSVERLILSGECHCDTSL